MTTSSDPSLETAFPAMVAIAGQAPSVHNTQPWRFHRNGEAVELYADRSRLLAVADPDARELRISCGAALFNLRLAATSLGREPEVELLPDPADPDLLARLRLGAERPQTAEDKHLLAAVPRRHSHRAPFGPAPIPRDLLVELQGLVEAEGASLHLIESEGTRAGVARWVRAAEEQLQSDPAFGAEVADWTPPAGSRRRDGVPATAYPARPPGGSADLPMRDFDLGRGWGWHERAAANSNSEIALLLTERDTPADHLRAGQALQRMLLTAAMHWVFASFSSAAVQLPHMRVLVRDELGITDVPQLLMRMGTATAAQATPRRPVEEISDEEPG